MQTITKRLLTWALIIAALLMVPLVAMQFSSEWDWNWFDFAFMGCLLLGSALIYELIAPKKHNDTYRIAVGIAVVTTIVITWINGAVGIIGNEDHPANLMYFGVILIGLIGTQVARLQPRGMSRAMFITAIAQALVPIIAVMIWRPQLDTGVLKVFILNTVFVMLFVESGLLFRKASMKLKAEPKAK
ncbi:hypothetical protein KA517_00610 [Candidatus Gracilibacteria bacterium]|nr:hypothetical protein [Candidatus Gracilibacteria bacterium]